MKRKILDFPLQHARLVFIGLAVLTIGFGSAIPWIQVDTDPENMLSENDPDRVFHNETKEEFALHDLIVVGVVNEVESEGVFNPESLARVHELNERLKDIDGVIARDVLGPSTMDNIEQAGPGTIRFEWLMEQPPKTPEEALAIKEAAMRLPMLRGTVVSEDGDSVALYVPIESKDQSHRISEEIRTIIDGFDASADEFYITGLPVAEDTFGVEMFTQMAISAPLAALVILLLMWWFFRSFALVLSPMIVALTTVTITMGALIASGFTVHIMSSMIPIFLMPIAVVDSVHIMSDFADRYRPGDNARQLISDVVDHLFTPMLFTSLTSAVGFLSLLLTPIPPVQIFGAFVAFGILLAFVLTIMLIPAYVVRMNPAALEKLALRSKTPHSDTALARMLRRGGRFAVRRARLVAGISLMLVSISVAGVYRIEINDNPVRWFKANHAIRVADDVLNDHFAGTYDAFLVLTHQDSAALPEFVAAAEALLSDVERSQADPLRKLLHGSSDGAGDYFGTLIAAIDDALFDADSASIDALEKLMALAEAAEHESKYFQRPDILQGIADIQLALGDTGLVGKTNALPDVVKVVSRELQGGGNDEYRIPATAVAVAQTLLQYQSSHRPQDLWHMVTPDFSSTAIWLQLKSGDNNDMSEVVESLDNYLAANPLPVNVEARWAGKTFINVVWQDTMVSGMLKSLLGAFAFVFVMMALLFRNPRLGLLAMVPLSVTILGAYGLIGWLGKDYDMPIAVLSSLTLGLSVDFAIHFIQRTREFLRSSNSFEFAQQKMFEEPARAIARNAIVIAIGFTPLFFAPLVPYITVGAFMAGIMTVSGLATLFLLPALISLAGPWLFPNIGKRGAFAETATEEIR